MTTEEKWDKVCGKSPKRYPDKKCCVAYVPEGMLGIPGILPVKGAEGPHRHLVTHKFADGSLGAYSWGPGRRKESWALIQNTRGMKEATQEEFEKKMKEVSG